MEANRGKTAPELGYRSSTEASESLLRRGSRGLPSVSPQSGYRSGKRRAAEEGAAEGAGGAAAGSGSERAARGGGRCVLGEAAKLIGLRLRVVACGESGVSKSPTRSEVVRLRVNSRRDPAAPLPAPLPVPLAALVPLRSCRGTAGAAPGPAAPTTTCDTSAADAESQRRTRARLLFGFESSALLLHGALVAAGRWALGLLQFGCVTRAADGERTLGDPTAVGDQILPIMPLSMAQT
ncbi:unnamed protein product [Closterium sp. NIES-64]|nr:unnamed protein product [Closterium sp. NIES-64]